MGKVLMYMKSDMIRSNADHVETQRYLQRRIDALDNYTNELENRLAAMECVVSNLLNGGQHHVVESVIQEVRELQQHDMTDLDRLLAEFETDDEFEENWFDDLF